MTLTDRARWLAHRFNRRRGMLFLAGGLICSYAVAVLLYVQTIPDIGLRSIFSPVVKGKPRLCEGVQPQEGDIVRKVGDFPIRSWSDLLVAPFAMRQRVAANPDSPWIKQAGDRTLVKVEFDRPEVKGAVTRLSTWCTLGGLPPEDLVPSVLWFCLKMMLFLVGALVLWKRPHDSAAAQFFLLCIFTVGAYMGGYNWPYIATNIVLLTVFIVCAVMLPPVSLHFYLLFPRRKQWLERRPRLSLLAIYGPSLVCLVCVFGLYFWHQRLYRQGAAQEVVAVLQVIQFVSSAYLVVASLLYLASITSLILSVRSAKDATEKKQVQWILCGAVLALVPIAYSFYLAMWNPDAFGAGAATWPMFTASVLLTIAFFISITRYRLLELDQIISSGVGYFLVSVLAGLVYYIVVFVEMLLFNASPEISEALTVSTTALVLMLVLDMARGRLKKVLDRRLSRDKSQLDRTFQRLGQAIEQLVDPQVLAKRLLQASTELLGVTRGAVFLRQVDSTSYKMADSFGEPFSLSELPAGSPLIEALQEGRVVVDHFRAGGAISPPKRQLRFLGGEIAQPLTHEGRLLALLVLGHRHTPYRDDDLHLLAAFAQITVLALVSAEGHRTIEQLNVELQTKVEKISEQQRRILMLQSQLKRHRLDESAGAENNEAGTGMAEAAAKEAPPPGGIVGSGPVVRQLLHLVKKVSSTDAVVLIRGESGTGKELLARAVHETSARAGKPFVKVHCAALSPGLLESELFGHVKGAFTGAHRNKVGRFELATGGTLFLDEIGDVTLEVQTKLLRVLQEKAFERVGSSDPVTVDVRIIAATHQDLEVLIRQGRFREDLFYRLNVFPIQVPPLRDRREDIAELATHFIHLSSERCHKSVLQIDDDALALLKAHDWPGNIRQLGNMIERAVVIAEESVISVHELPEEISRTGDGEDLTPVLEPVASNVNGNGNGNGKPLAFDRRERERLERELLVQALAAAKGNKAEAARALGLARSTFLSRLKKLGLA